MLWGTGGPVPDPPVTGPREVLEKRLLKQAAACAQLGSPLYAGLLERSASDVARGGAVWRALEDHALLPSGAAIALRFMGAMHRLVLQGRLPVLASYYPSAGGNEEGDPWPAFVEGVEKLGESLRPLLDRGVQTNEVGRAAALIGGFLEVTRRTGLPLRLLEIGASAGLNLRWDHFRYEAAGRAWGPEGSPVRLAGFDPAPDFSTPAEVAERRGCDPDPVDPTTEEGRLTLSSYVWPDQAERWDRLLGALRVAEKVPAAVDRAPAAEWLPQRLKERPAGVATVVFHTIVWQYIDPSGQNEVRAAMEEAGAAANSDSPLAWLWMEPPLNSAEGTVRGGVGPGDPNFAAANVKPDDLAEVHLTLWPGGETRLVGRAGYHGRPVRWLGEP